MGKQPAAAAAGGGEPRSRARASGTAPPARHREEIAHGVRHAVAPGDGGGAGTSAAAAAGDRSYSRHAISHEHQRVQFKEGQTGVHDGRRHAQYGPEQPPVHGDGGAEAPAGSKPGQPYYMSPWQKRSRQPVRPPIQEPHVLTHEKRPAMPAVPGGTTRQENTLTNQKTIERTSTIRDDDDVGGGGVPHGGLPPAGVWPEGRPSPSRPRTKSPSLFHPTKKKRQPVAFCFTACCILFWLLVIAVGTAVLVIFLIYHPQSPKMQVTSATLNAGYVDELGGPAGGGPRALNADLTVLAAIYNPNTKLHVVLRYMQLDLYFEGSMIATQAVWPAPLHEGPRGNVLRSVHLVVSEVTMTQEDVAVWQRATGKGGPVVLQLAGRFRAQLIFGRWFRFNYWVSPQCTLWLDPPPSGALRRARC
ncbi:uncharacterized protein LOC102702346 [Oryza brachyantha]|uniref:Late embryogenesis abundant protein LEA-2 subgroup domain-containing protein n=1 Tax=Oryza brachyantha TaxID=4533 RepID=J3L6Z0_ORYBR|nr:uncharacterized protein LOC102702346 [Oryza brachyantha]